MRRGEEEGRRREGGGKEEEREEEEQAGRRRDTDGTQAGHEEEEEKTGAERGWGSRVRVHDSCSYSSIVFIFLQITVPYISYIFWTRHSLSRRGSDS